MADNPLSGGRNLALLSIAIAAAVHAEGLYKADSPVTSYVALSEVPSGAGSEQPFTLIEYYSAWCGHCQKFAPTYEAIARYRANDKGGAAASLDGTMRSRQPVAKKPKLSARDIFGGPAQPDSAKPSAMAAMDDDELYTQALRMVVIAETAKE
jgi:thiol-disulfide isomerase/thioredoxin